MAGVDVEALAYVIALCLAVTFVVAAVGKAVQRSAVVEGFAAMGLAVPELLAVAVPAIEVVAAVLLVVVPWVGATLALALLAAFTLVLGRLRASGQTLACRCFGAASSEPISVAQFVRNGLMMLAAVVALVAVRGMPGAAELATGVGIFAVGTTVTLAVGRAVRG